MALQALPMSFRIAGGSNSTSCRGARDRLDAVAGALEDKGEPNQGLAGQEPPDAGRQQRYGC